MAFFISSDRRQIEAHQFLAVLLNLIYSSAFNNRKTQRSTKIQWYFTYSTLLKTCPPFSLLLCSFFFYFLWLFSQFSFGLLLLHCFFVLRFECGNYIFIVSVAKLSSKIVDSRLGCHKKRVKARILSEARKRKRKRRPQKNVKEGIFWTACNSISCIDYSCLCSCYAHLLVNIGRRLMKWLSSLRGW